jgi:hypothetical protein
MKTLFPAAAHLLLGILQYRFRSSSKLSSSFIGAESTPRYSYSRFRSSARASRGPSGSSGPPGRLARSSWTRSARLDQQFTIIEGR